MTTIDCLEPKAELWSTLPSGPVTQAEENCGMVEVGDRRLGSGPRRRVRGAGVARLRRRQAVSPSPCRLTTSRRPPRTRCPRARPDLSTSPETAGLCCSTLPGTRSASPSGELGADVRRAPGTGGAARRPDSSQLFGSFTPRSPTPGPDACSPDERGGAPPDAPDPKGRVEHGLSFGPHHQVVNLAHPAAAHGQSDQLT